jgi:uncharacterized protein YbjT (DUF2867 family)
MDVKKRTAILLGATGLTGSYLLKMLLEDERYGTIKLFSRSSVNIEHSKIQEYLGDILHLENFGHEFFADEVYCCIGTTKSKTPDVEKYKQIDHGIPVAAATLCVKNNIPTFIVVSALGADTKSSIFYNRIKGHMEEDVLALRITNTYILEPSMIGGERNERRTGEWIAKQVFKVFNGILTGPLKKYRSIHPETIAKAMIWVASNEYSNPRIPSDEITRLAASK